MIGKSGEGLKGLDPLLTPGFGLAVRALHRRKAAPDATQALVVRPGGLGDLVIAHLAAERLGVADRVTWLIERRSAAWAKYRGLPYLNYDEDPLRAARGISSRFPLVINTEQRFGLSMTAARWAAARGGTVVGFETNRGARLADRLVSYDWDRSHELAEFSRILAESFGLPMPPVGAIDRRRPSDDTIVVALGGTHSPSRALSPRDWASWLLPLIGSHEVLLTAGPMERELAAELLDQLGGQATLFKGSFDEVVDRIATAERVVTIDGGLVHVASYFGVPCDVLFTAGRSSKWAPLGRGSRVHRRHDLSCQPCTVFGQVPPCPFGYLCRHGIPETLAIDPVETASRT
ncbi:MAG: glycosyltransferase family 9 protein [Labedaea sp.]